MGFRQYRKTHAAGGSVAESIESDKRVRDLEKELQDVKAERDFLKKAAAFFARDHR